MFFLCLRNRHFCLLSNSTLKRTSLAQDRGEIIDITQPMRIGEGSPRLGGRDCNKHKRACQTLPILCDTAVFAQGLLS